MTTPPLVFFGTPRFAVPTLERLLFAGYRPTVVTQPKRPTGRGLNPRPSPVAEAAAAAGLTVLAPDRLDQAPALTSRLAAVPAAVVVAYGRWIPEPLLRLPANGFLNLHPSLLPRYRGASPIPAAILNGDTETGVSLIVLDNQLDHGPIVAQRTVHLEPAETAASLAERLSRLGAELVVASLPGYLAGQHRPRPQNDAQASFTKTLGRLDGQIDWRHPAAVIERQLRAYTPWPGAWTLINDQPLKILAARVSHQATEGPPGSVQPRLPLTVSCGQAGLELLTLQFPGGRPLKAAAAVHGHALLGQRFSGPWRVPSPAGSSA